MYKSQGHIWHNKIINIYTRHNVRMHDIQRANQILLYNVVGIVVNWKIQGHGIDA